MTIGTLLLDAGPSAHHAAETYLHHHHHHPSFGGVLLGVGLALLAGMLVRALVRRRGFRHGPRRMIRSLFRRLDTSPSQEKVIREALDELREGVGSLRGEGKTVREGLGRAIAGDRFDGAALEAAFAGPEAKLPELRDAVGRALGRIHEVLTPAQRKELAAIVSAGPGFFAYRRRHAC